MSFYGRYVHDLQSALSGIPWPRIDEIVGVLHTARRNGNHVYIMGNGGSAATALHMACDIGKNTVVPGFPRLRAISLTDNMALFSAHANDNTYAEVFAEQLANLARPGDVAIAISASGNSPNVLRGIATAKSLGAMTIGWSGGSGGQLAELAEISVVVPCTVVEQIEDVHLILEHIVTLRLRETVIAEIGAEARPGIPQPVRTLQAVAAVNGAGGLE
jgi:D-sedoheptulose 7-phosphate isomerase